MMIRARWILAVLLPVTVACSLPTKGLAPGRDAGGGLDASQSDGGDSCVAGTEVCNGVDDDCDGEVDEGVTRACGLDVGACSHGTETCEAGVWTGTCVGEVAPAPAEICEGSVDENCDGSVDEGCACTPGDTQPCGSDVGACVPGTQTCGASAVWSDCVGATGPTTEVCDGLDNNCDGSIDEGLMRACGDGTGECVRGSQMCASGAWASCTGGVGPTPEICDGLDNNCDGSVDEGLTRACGDGTGECVRGSQMCASGAWASCTGGVGPTTEVCNGLDDNCDGSIDEGGVCSLSGCTWVEDRGHAYQFCDPGVSLTWSQASAACAAVGYHLVTIDDDAENTFVWARADSVTSAKWWLGLTDAATERSFVWEDGTTPPCQTGQHAGPPYCHWRAGRPRNDTNKNCVVVDTNRGSGVEWDDDSCTNARPFVCEAP